MNRSLLSMLILTLLFFSACDSSDSDDSTLTLSFTKLDPLTNGYHYEGWAIVKGSAISTGKFNVNAQGQLVTLGGSTISQGRFEVDHDLMDASAIVITIEPNGDTDTVPAQTKYLGGDVSGGSASLSAAHGSSLGNSFSSAAGKYILATPTDGPNTNETSGVWFLDPSSGSPVAGLSLPALPAGWEYEGWVVLNGTPVTTGRFTELNKADQGAPFSGTSAGPPFPGEDFLRNAPSGLTFPTNLSGSTVVISIEPSPDDNAGPFTLKPLVGTVPANAQSGTVYNLQGNLASFATGTARIQ